MNKEQIEKALEWLTPKEDDIDNYSLWNNLNDFVSSNEEALKFALHLTLKVMSEPTQKMIKAGEDCGEDIGPPCGFYNGEPIDVYKAMRDELIKDVQNEMKKDGN